MLRFITAWLRAVFRHITAWLQAADDPDAAFLQRAAAADDSDAASLQGTAAMDFPVTVSLGPLHRPLHSFRATKNDLPDGVSEGDVRRLEADLESLFTQLKVVAEADDPSFTARCWMKEVRELRYDAEDFFGEVPRPCAGRSALLAVILWIPSKLKRRRQAAEAFSDLQVRARDASRRRQSFQLGPATLKPEFWQASVSGSKRLQLIGLEESMDKLVKLLALDDQEIADLLAFDSEGTEEQVQVVPIFGSAGVGKTTLARVFYHNFGGKFQCRAFVRVSRNPDMRRMLSSMLSQIKAPPVRGFPDVQDLIDHIREYLQFKRYLIVIDDLWTSSTWDIISRAFADGDCCSRIIVTTEIKDVALACSRHQFKYIYEMSPLNGDQSRKLFLGRVFGSENCCPPDFKEVSYEIIQKCGGLPLAIENIASMLACELDVDQWKHVRDSLLSVLSLRTSPSSEGLKEVLNIIYNNLSPYLKTCLLYLIMYPEGNTISKEDLMKQWVAEDLIGEGQDREKTARDYFDELVSRGMIQPADTNYNDEVLTCTVHHMVLDLIRSKSLEENFIINVNCFQTTPGLPDKVRRLSVQFGGAKCANIPADFMMTQVRSLIFFGFLNCVPSIVEYKLLRVLVLHIWADQSKIFDLTRINELFQLRYLKIDCNITVHLPDEIRQLKFLETLELHAPVNDMPSDISCLPLLLTLGYFDLSKNSIENVQSLGKLNNLQDLHLTWSNTAEPDNLKKNMQCLSSILWKLSNLKSLTLVPAMQADVLSNAGGASVGISGDVLSSVSSPPALLQRLELSGHCCIFSSLPKWTKELGNLCILKIAVRKLLRKDIDILKRLPALMALSLYIWTAPVGKVVFDDEGFSVLKYFKFACAAPCVAFLKGAMPSVRELKLAFSANRMEQYPQIVPGLEYLIELREITAEVGATGADESNRRYAESALSSAITSHPCTPVIRVQCIEHMFFGDSTQEQEHWTLEEQHEIQEELLDPLPEFLISTPSTQTEMRYGEQDEGRDRSVENGGTERSREALTQEQQHMTLVKQDKIQEELLDPLPELLSTSSTQTQTRDGDGEMERSMEVLRQEQEECTLEKQHEMADGVQDVQIGRLMEVVAQEEHNTLQKQHEIEKKWLDPPPELLSIPSTPSTQTQLINRRLNGGIGGSMEVVSASHGTLGPLLGKLVGLLAGEHAGLKGVRREVRSLRAELASMHAGMTKYTMLEDPDVQVKDWISLVRELSYDTEDCIDKFIHQLGNDSRHSGFKQFFRKTARQLKTLGSRHGIAEKMDDLKTRIKELKELKNSYKLDDIAGITSYHSTMDPSLSALFAEDANLVGIEAPREDLAKWMVETGNNSAKHHLRVLSIVGFAGLGKTTLANEVYRKTKEHFNCQAFVSVSQKPNIKKILRELISQVSSHGFTEDIDNWDEMRSIAKLRELLQDKSTE
nr:NBS-LRR disease resistance protein [Dasypyrum villosum]